MTSLLSYVWTKMTLQKSEQTKERHSKIAISYYTVPWSTLFRFLSHRQTIETNGFKQNDLKTSTLGKKFFLRY